MKPLKFFKYKKNHFLIKKFWNIEEKPSKFKYINFRDLFLLFTTGGTNQLTEVQ